jgi:hypothetical protein
MAYYAMRFFLGLLCGLLCGLFCLGGYLLYIWHEKAHDPCLGYCGEGTSCQADRCLPLDQQSNSSPVKKSRRGIKRRRTIPGATPGANPEEEPVQRLPSAADLKELVQGPALGKTDVVDLSSSGGPSRELSQEDVDQRVRALEPRILDCIDKARGDYRIERGKVVVAFRIERSGRIEGVRTTAPSVMQRAGLHACLGQLINGLRFPVSGRALILSYPYELR